ncbi:MAG: glycoside hydrolase family 18 protein [Planctomycetaceae bacterium]|nr:glycoside hydrolase family 18 protein [Planctomycetaceae bacterium]
MGLLLVVTSLSCQAQTRPEPDERFLGAYLPEYRLNQFDAEHLTALTDLMLFSVEVEAEGRLNLDRWGGERLRRLDEIAVSAPCRVLMSVGGWGRSKGFPAVAADPGRRKRFANELIQFCEQHRLDGIDIDWEHPSSEEERALFVVLMQDLGRELHRHQLLLTTALAPWKPVDPQVAMAIDRIHLMSYDDEGRHSTPEQAEANIRKWVAAGIPARKLCLGIPCYGKPIERDGRPARTYRDLVDRQTGNQLDEVDGYYFNGPATVERKVDLAREQKLPGVFFWEMAQDLPANDPHSLIQTAAKRLRDGP